MLVWPSALLYAESVDWRPEGGTVSGGASVAGIAQIGLMGGGPVWRLSIDGLWLADRQSILACRAIHAALDGGGTPIEIGTCDFVLSPYPPGATLHGVPYSDGTSHSDGSLYGVSPIVAEVASAAALRATTLTLQITAGSALIGGEDLSIDHPTQGRRRYRIIGITGGTAEAPEIRIRPPLREALTGGELVDFNRPSCLMRLVSGLNAPVEHGRLAQTSAEFVEWFGDLEDF